MEVICTDGPGLEVSHEVLNPDSLTAGAPIKLQVSLEREDEDESDHTAVAPFFPGAKTENWWIVVGEANKGKQVIYIFFSISSV